MRRIAIAAGWGHPAFINLETWNSLPPYRVQQCTVTLEFTGNVTGTSTTAGLEVVLSTELVTVILGPELGVSMMTNGTTRPKSLAWIFTVRWGEDPKGSVIVGDELPSGITVPATSMVSRRGRVDGTEKRF